MANSNESDIRTTNRGFEIVEFTDHNGVKCSIQQSSAIDMSVEGSMEHPGSSLLWLGCNSADPKYFVPHGDPAWRPVPMPEQYVANTRMHLDRVQVIALIGQLQAWLETGTFYDDGILNAKVIDD